MHFYGGKYTNPVYFTGNCKTISYLLGFPINFAMIYYILLSYIQMVMILYPHMSAHENSYFIYKKSSKNETHICAYLDINLK